MRLTFLFLLTTSIAFPQSFSGLGGFIPDNQADEAVFTITTSALPTVSDANFGFAGLCFNIQHTYDSDLQIKLEAPDGTMVQLVMNAGGDSDDFTGTCFDQSASESVQLQTGPFSGTFKPFGNFGFFNNGSNPNGDWKLHLFDTGPADFGILFDWSIVFSNSPAPPVPPFISSELPIIDINTGGQNIQDDPKIGADLQVFWTPGQGLNTVNDLPHYDGKTGIEYRGSSSQGFPKKSYGFETWDLNSIQLDFPLLDFPAESDWILSASYSDKSLINNTLAYRLSRDLGHYAPRCKHVELLIDNQYQGVYVLMEKIKRDTNRVNVSKLSTADISGNDLTGGYIIKIDKPTGSGGDGWNSTYQSIAPTPSTIYFQYEYPNDQVILPEQKNYIQSYVDSFETALKFGPYDLDNQGWRKYADEQSFIDYLIINELSKNVDGYRLSTYLHKNKITHNGKLVIGPAWDYDLGFANADYCEGSVVDGWAYDFNSVCGGDYFHIPFWWETLMTDDLLFQRRLSCRYKELRSNVLSTDYLYNYVDSITNFMQNATSRNFELWPILGTYVWPNPSPLPVDYQGELDELKTWLLNRLTWMDANMPDPCDNMGLDPNGVPELKIYPNPAKNTISIDSEEEITFYRVTNPEGKEIDLKLTDQNKTWSVNTSALSSGFYLLEVRIGSKDYKLKFVKE